MKIGRGTVRLDNIPKVVSYASAAGKKESEGPLGKCFDIVSKDSLFDEKTFERAESKLQQLALSCALGKKELTYDDVDMIFAGDLLNQCISSSFGIRQTKIPFVGVYGACSTMALSLCLAALTVDSGAANMAAAVTSSHFCSAERQYRFPLDYGCQRPQTAQWTVTGSGAVVLGNSGKAGITNICFGKVTDLNVKDANNMGAAMAPVSVKLRPYPVRK